MNKIFFSSFLIVVILAVIFAGYYYYQDARRQPASNSPDEKILELPGQENEECGALVNEVVDGVFQKTENNFLYFIPKDKERTEAIALTDKTEFFVLNFSKEMEMISQTKISLEEFSQEDQISVVALCDSENPDDRKALVVRKIAVEPENN